jgi:predicted dehydrogenase
MTNAVRVGVIGVARRWWRHYYPSLLRLPRRFRIQALCDPIYERAAAAARRLGCDAAAGPTDLLQRDDVEALLLLDTPWYGLWPLAAACRVGKPVLCSRSLPEDEPHVDALRQRIQESRLPVVMGLSPRLAPATGRLRELIATKLGPPRLLLCDWSSPANRDGESSARLWAGILGRVGVVLADWCATVLGSEPQTVRAVGAEEAGWGCVVLECAGRQRIQITCHTGPGVARALRLQLVAERGSAIVEVPERVCWSTAAGHYSYALAGHRPLTSRLLEHFWQVVRAGATPEPTFEEAYRARGWLRAAAASHAEGCPVSLLAPRSLSDPDN